MEKRDLHRVKQSILKCLTEDFNIGSYHNQAIFDKSEGFARCEAIDLKAITDKVMLGLYVALHDGHGDRCESANSRNEEL